MNSRIIPITDFIRKFGDYAAILPFIDELIVTREGRPFATIKATPEEKNRELLKCVGLWKGSVLDSDDFWKNVFVIMDRVVMVVALMVLLKMKIQQ